MSFFSVVIVVVFVVGVAGAVAVAGAAVLYLASLPVTFDTHTQ